LAEFAGTSRENMRQHPPNIPTGISVMRTSKLVNSVQKFYLLKASYNSNTSQPISRTLS
jgi:hypothetical protein